MRPLNVMRPKSTTVAASSLIGLRPEFEGILLSASNLFVVDTNCYEVRIRDETKHFFLQTNFLLFLTMIKTHYTIISSYMTKNQN